MKSNPETMKPIIQIGPVCDDPTESVSSVNKAMMDGLKDKYAFQAPSSNRRHGTTKQARFNGWNLVYMAKHTWSWLWSLIRCRPAVAHYGLTTSWALEKGLFLLFLARLFGAKTIGHIHAGDFGEYVAGLSGWRRDWAMKQLRSLDAFVVLSDYWREVVAECAGIPRDRIFVVSNPIAAGFEQAALRIPTDRPGNSILSMGTMGRDKGVLDILDAAALVRADTDDFDLILAGPEREPGILDIVKLQIAASSLESRISLLSGVWGEAKVELFRKAGIMLLPSYIENFPLVVLEAAAAGQAIVTTPVGAVPEFFENGVSAIFVEPGNPRQLAAAILRLLKNPEERHCLATAARQVFESRLGRAGIMASLAAAYARVLHRPFEAADSALSRSSGTGTSPAGSQGTAAAIPEP